MTHPDSLATPPLRVGVLVDAAIQPRWICRVVESIVAAPECELAFLAVGSAAPREPSLPARIARAPGRALFECFRALDDRVYGRPGDAHAPCDVRAAAGDAPREAPADAPLDVVLRLGRDAPSEALAARARHGVWSLHFGGRSAADVDAAGLYEVLANAGATVTELRVGARDGAPGGVIARAVTRSDVRSVRRGRNVFLAKSAALVLRALRDLRDGRPADATGAAPVPRPTTALPSAPANGEMARLILGHGLRYAQQRVDHALFVEQWVLAWQRSPAFPGPEEFRYLLPPTDRFWADPFPAVRDARHFIFFEELVYADNKGHISVVELDAQGAPGAVERVLVRPYHLSYPFLLRHEGEDFMMPEGSASGGVEVYRARRFPRDWELVDVMLPKLRVSDATVRRIGDRWWLFADVAVDGTRTPSEELHLFYGPTPFGPWTPHRRNPIHSDAGRSRPAGAVFEHDGRLYRPAQDCATRYGYAVSFNEIVRIDPDDYAEVDRGRMLPAWDPRLVATHTVNRDGDLTVIDAVMRRPR